MPEGTIVVGAETAKDGDVPTGYFVLQDTPALSGKDITDPKQGFSSGVGASGAPNVTFSFSDKGQDLGPVGGSDDDDAGGAVKAVHLGQQLIQGLLALLVGDDGARDASITASQPGSSVCRTR